jgi:hypothetical protein
MAPFSVNGRRRRPTSEPAPNGSDYGQPVRLGENEPVRFGGVSSGDSTDGAN